jgi:hypothetical protein
MKNVKSRTRTRLTDEHLQFGFIKANCRLMCETVRSSIPDLVAFVRMCKAFQYIASINEIVAIESIKEVTGSPGLSGGWKPLD